MTSFHLFPMLQQYRPAQKSNKKALVDLLLIAALVDLPMAS